MNHVIETYENYKEEDRLNSNNARRIEFITSMRAIKDIFPKKQKYWIVLLEQGNMLLN